MPLRSNISILATDKNLSKKNLFIGKGWHKIIFSDEKSSIFMVQIDGNAIGTTGP
jgi:hypothetical protein